MKRRSFSEEPQIEFRIGRFLVHPGEGRVRGDDGQEQRLEPQVVAVLCYLAAHPGRVISRQELLQEVWNGTAVSDGAVTRCIGVIRKHLTTGGVDPILTVPKRGYELVLPVTDAGSDEAKLRNRSTLTRVATLVMTSAAIVAFVVAANTSPAPPDRSPSVLVAGIDDLDRQARDEGWGRAVTEELIAQIHTTPGLDVVVDASADEPADAILTGSVRREGDEARVSCQLVDRQSRRVLCAGSCSKPATPRLEAQESAARCMAQATRGAMPAP